VTPKNIANLTWSCNNRRSVEEQRGTHKIWRTLHVRRRSRNSPKELFLRGAGTKYACTAGRKHTNMHGEAGTAQKSYFYVGQVLNMHALQGENTQICRNLLKHITGRHKNR
jgi:hypothetical protein